MSNEPKQIRVVDFFAPYSETGLNGFKSIGVRKLIKSAHKLTKYKTLMQTPSWQKNVYNKGALGKIHFGPNLRLG